MFSLVQVEMHEKFVFFSFFVLWNFRYCKAEMEAKIVGGSDAGVAQFPHAVYLDVACDNYICGSSVLNQWILLTAAHCVSSCRYKDKVEAFAGQPARHLMTDKKTIISMKLHEDFDEITLANDIALLRLNRVLEFSNIIKRVIITPSFPEVTRAAVTGWGLIDDNGTLPSILKWTTQKLLPRWACSAMGRIHKGMLCAGNLHKDASRPAEGDSGSALVCGESNSHQIGIISFTTESHPSITVYTNVTHYYYWIRRHVETLFCLNHIH